MRFFKKSSERSYVIIEEETEVNNEVVEVSEEEIPKKIDFTNLLQNASLENGKKIAKQCSACHSFDNSMKIKVGPPLLNIVGRKSASISDFKYSKALNDYKKNWSIEELFLFLKIQKNTLKGQK